MKIRPRLILCTLLLALTLPLFACRTTDGLADDMEEFGISSFPEVIPRKRTPSAETLTAGNACPLVKIVEELGTYNEFSDPSAMNAGNLLSRARITNMKTSCDTGNEDTVADLRITFEGTLGPQARAVSSDTPFFSYPFFVAIAGENGKVLAKDVFSINMTYESGENAKTHVENMRQILPKAARGAGEQFKILIGFQLDSDQLAYNRKALKSARKAAPRKAEAARAHPAAAHPPSSAPQPLL